MNNLSQGRVPGLTVILSTYNRAGDIHKTLDAFCDIDIDGLDVEFVVVDNNSHDGTPEVIQSFAKRIPLRHLFESRAGKNCALNHAIDTVELKEIVVFTDDDVTPDRNWLKHIAASCERWPEHAVFGGKILVDWPNGKAPPDWCSASWFHTVAFAVHDLGDAERPYLPNSYPFGPNLWVRSSIFSNNFRYNENLGPRPNNRLMGSETSFLIGLANRGMLPVYVPAAVVKHRVQAGELNKRGLMRRAFRFGRSQPHLERLKSTGKPAINILFQLLELGRSVLAFGYSYFPGKPEKRFSSRFGSLVRMGRAKELLKFAFDDLGAR